jgi:hypothetical protein
MNIVAHDITRHGYNSNSGSTWVDESPSFLLQPLLDDVTDM